MLSRERRHCSQHVSWSWSQTTDPCGEMARPNAYPPPFMVISVQRHACQLIKLCSENATFYRRQSVVFHQWHPSPHRRPHRRCSIMAAAPSLLTARLSDLCRHIQHDVRETTHRAGLSVTADTCQIFKNFV